MKSLMTFLLAGGLALGAPINGPTTVKLVNAGGALDSNSYDIGPYTLAIDGKDYAVMCIDFKDDSRVGSSWRANFTDLASTIFSKTYLGNGRNTATIYDEEAYLFNMLLSTNDETQRTNIQHAAWSLTDPAYELNSGAKQDVKLAEENCDSKAFQSTLADFEIISDVDMGRGRNQEFIVRAETPEPRSLALIGAGLLLITGLLRKMTIRQKG